MKERPILFSGAMVRAILDGSKTQTRRALRLQPPENFMKGDVAAITNGERRAISNSGFSGGKKSAWPEDPLPGLLCPYGQVGDRLWVRETSIISPKNFAYKDDSCVTDYDGDHRFIQYLATHSCREAANDYKLKATPSIHMPRWASRITLEIVNIRVERLQDISVMDAIAEGCTSAFEKGDMRGARCEFNDLWESINGAGSWDANPWVWAIEFKRV